LLRFGNFGASLGRPRRRWEDNIKVDFEDVGCREAWTGLTGLGQGQKAGFIKRREFLDELRTCQLLRKDSAPWR